MTTDNLAPVEIDFYSATAGATTVTNAAAKSQSLKTFTSYSFDRSVITPASTFRFTAPGIDIATRQAIRSGDMAFFYVKNAAGTKIPLGVGIIDETDTHVTPTSVEYVLTGRDILGQLVDNAAVDANNLIVNFQASTLDTIVKLLIKNTRVPQNYIPRDQPTGKFIFQTTPGETKINILQRYCELANCLVWANEQGQIIVGKPNFSHTEFGKLIMKSSDPTNNNILESRVRRNLNQALRQVVSQLQTLGQVTPGGFTIKNADSEMQAVYNAGVGKSLYRVFSYGQGDEAANNITGIGSGAAQPATLGRALSLREIARENQKVLEVECVVKGHLNTQGAPYNVDQIYDVQIEADSVSQHMYVYSVSYEMTIDHGLLTRLHLCKPGTIVADAPIVKGAQ